MGHLHCGQWYIHINLIWPTVLIFRIAEVFISENSTNLKEMIIANFVEHDTVARVVFCTEAFGMGLDCPNIQQVIHFCPAKGIENYIQEVGRGGRNGSQTVALCINAPTHASVNRIMRDYVSNTTKCRRVALFVDALGTFVSKPLCKCCDMCITLQVWTML